MRLEATQLLTLIFFSLSLFSSLSSFSVFCLFVCFLLLSVPQKLHIVIVCHFQCYTYHYCGIVFANSNIPDNSDKINCRTHPSNPITSSFLDPVDLFSPRNRVPILLTNLILQFLNLLTLPQIFWVTDLVCTVQRRIILLPNTIRLIILIPARTRQRALQDSTLPAVCVLQIFLRFKKRCGVLFFFLPPFFSFLHVWA